MSLKLPLFLSPVSAGFPSPADDYLERKLDLNEFLIRHPAATFFLRVEGDSMKDAGIYSEDLLIVDRAEEVRDGSIVVAVLQGEFTLKRFRKRGNRIFLVPENDSYSAIEIKDELSLVIWGVVIASVRKHLS